jgi:membrane protease YdiL (CAAX protease family)
MALYFALAFGVAWACQIPVYALHINGPLALVLLALGGIAPSVAAVVVTRGAVWRELVRGPKPVWAITLGLLGWTAIAGLVGAVTGTLAFAMPYLGSVLLPPIGEELGWRGYLQPRVRSSLVVGAIWALWHLPTAIGHLETFPLFAVSCVAASILIGWLRDRGASLVACVAAHAGLNLQLAHASPAAMMIVRSALAIVVLVSAARVTAARSVEPRPAPR